MKQNAPLFCRWPMTDSSRKAVPCGAANRQIEFILSIPTRFRRQATKCNRRAANDLRRLAKIEPKQNAFFPERQWSLCAGFGPVDRQNDNLKLALR